MEQRKQIAQSWHDFFIMNRDEVSGVKDIVFESWKRCRENKVNFENQFIHDGDIERRAKSIENNHFLIDIARPYMSDLYKIISDTNFMITLLDKEGYVIDFLVHPILVEKSEFNILNYSEERIGTNAMGTSLYLNKPVLTFGEEHCYKHLHNFTTSAAPIHSIHGSLIGCIGITGLAEDVSVHTLGMSIATAYAIENSIRIHQDNKNMPEYNNIIKDYISDGVIITDQSGLIASINKTAENILGIKEQDFINKDIKEILGNIIDFSKCIEEDCDFINKKTVITINNKTINCVISLTKLKKDIKKSVFVIMINKIDVKLNNFSTSYKSKLFSFDDILGNSKLIKECIEIAKISSSGNSNILILGESGTGKELFAQSIHNESSRRKKPFIDVNCGALPINLAESELFGYEGGAYTGSKKEGQAGKFEMADGGTIFLDEIGELPLSLQASLLRVIQERKVTRIGSSHSKDIDIMIIAATNKDLYSAVKNNTFRADLFYRLNVFNINLPSLREHKEDIYILLDSFITKYNHMYRRNIEGVSEDVLKIFMKYNWPGNIRELDNIIQRAVQIARNNKIQQRDLPVYISTGVSENFLGYEQDLSIIESQELSTIINVIKKTNGNARLASQILGIGRSTLYRKLLKMGYDINDFRS